MNMAFTPDARPSAFGNMIVITGTVANGDTSTSLSDYMSEVLFAQVLANKDTAGPTNTTSIHTNGTTVVHADPGVAGGGKLFAIGHR